MAHSNTELTQPNIKPTEKDLVKSSSSQSFLPLELPPPKWKEVMISIIRSIKRTNKSDKLLMKKRDDQLLDVPINVAMAEIHPGKKIRDLDVNGQEFQQVIDRVEKIKETQAHIFDLRHGALAVNPHLKHLRNSDPRLSHMGFSPSFPTVSAVRVALKKPLLDKPEIEKASTNVISTDQSTEIQVNKEKIENQINAEAKVIDANVEPTESKAQSPVQEAPAKPSTVSATLFASCRQEVKDPSPVPLKLGY